MKKNKTPKLPSEIIRRKFAIEYVRDFDPIHALARTYDVSPLEVKGDASLKELAEFLPHEPSTNTLIETQLAYMQDKYDVDREFLILKTRQILDQCMKATPVMEKVRGQWVEAGEFEFDSLGAIKAVQTLYDITGIKQEAVEVDDDDKTGVMVVPDQLSPESWGDVVQQTRAMQEGNLEKVLQDFDPGDAEPN